MEGSKVMEKRSITAWLSLGVSVVAVVLSQLPPLRTFVSSAKLDVDLNRNLQVRHIVGDIDLLPYVQISNSGSAPGVIGTIEIIITRKDTPSFKKVLTAQSYFLKPTSVGLNQTPTAIPFGRIAVPPHETWDTYAEFFETPSSARRIEMARMQSNVSLQIQDALKAISPPNTKLAEISDELFTELSSNANARLKDFTIGEYILRARVLSTESQLLTEKCYTFAVYEGHISQLNAITEQYRYGAGITFPPPGQVGFLADLYDLSCPE
jgi:hypothetical protein